MHKIRYKKIIILILRINKILFIIGTEEIDILYNKSSIGFYKAFSWNRFKLKSYLFIYFEKITDY